MNLANRIALITGGSRGLGKNSALRLADMGADVIITYYEQNEAADAVVHHIENQYQRTALALQLDVTDVGMFDRFLEFSFKCHIRRHISVFHEAES